MRQNEFDIFIKEHRCVRCAGRGWLEYVGKIRCTGCSGYGLKIDDIDKIRIDDVTFIDLTQLAHQMIDGEVWLAFVDWSQLLQINMEELQRQKLVVQRLDIPTPRYGNYRDHFPETLFVLTVRGRLILNNPSRFVGIDPT